MVVFLWIYLLLWINIGWSAGGEFKIPKSSIGVHESIEISLVVQDLPLTSPPELKVGMGITSTFQNQSHISEIVVQQGQNRRVEEER